MPPEWPGAADVRVVHRDAHLLVVDKPPGLPTTSPDGTGCLVALVSTLDPEAPRLHPSSRLDAEVSGLVTFARTKRATRALLDARREGRYVRIYLGIAARAPEAEEGTWNAAIGIDPADPRRRVALAPDATGPRVQYAETHYRVRAPSLAGPVLLEMRPQTGRTHQLRVHAAHAGVPLLGDIHYGGPRRIVRDDGRVVTARRVMLHCASLELPDVARGRGSLSLESPLPEDVERVWGRLG